MAIVTSWLAVLLFVALFGLLLGAIVLEAWLAVFLVRRATIRDVATRLVLSYLIVHVLTLGPLALGLLGDAVGLSTAHLANGTFDFWFVLLAFLGIGFLAALSPAIALAYPTLHPSLRQERGWLSPFLVVPAMATLLSLLFAVPKAWGIRAGFPLWGDKRLHVSDLSFVADRVLHLDLLLVGIALAFVLIVARRRVRRAQTDVERTRILRMRHAIAVPLAVTLTTLLLFLYVARPFGRVTSGFGFVDVDSWVDTLLVLGSLIAFAWASVEMARSYRWLGALPIAIAAGFFLLLFVDALGIRRGLAEETETAQSLFVLALLLAFFVVPAWTISWAVLRDRVIDWRQDSRAGIRRAVTGTLLAFAFVLAFFLLSELAEGWLTDETGSRWVGLAGAGAMALAFHPLESAAQRLSNRLVPADARNADPRSSARRVYRATYEDATHDRVMTLRERRMLDTLARQLDLPDRIVEAIERGVEEERKNSPSAAPA